LNNAGLYTAQPNACYYRPTLLGATFTFIKFCFSAFFAKIFIMFGVFDFK